MGSVSTISHEHFPKQGEMLHKRVKVAFHYNLEHTIVGTIIRDDMEHPYQTIIQLDDGHYILGTECQYSINYNS